MTSFSIANRSGDTRWEVEGYVYGPIGIHLDEEYDDEWWVLTHIPTGLSITTFDPELVTVEQVQKVAERLSREVKGFEHDSKWKARLALLVWSAGENPIEKVRGMI